MGIHLDPPAERLDSPVQNEHFSPPRNSRQTTLLFFSYFPHAVFNLVDATVMIDFGPVEFLNALAKEEEDS